MTDAPNKPKITIDGQVIEFDPGDTIMKVAEKTTIDQKIPRFCYHPGLPVAGTCRMCTVEVEKAPKLMTACSTPATDGMVVHTQSEKVRKSRAGVMEFLLANHPLDCPVCDQAGECSLQNYNYEYGPGTSEFKEDKRVFKKATTKKLSEKLTLNMNRCIHCERCVRFTENVTKTNELLMNHRGWRKELTTALEAGMFNDYQGNIADICPVGAITFNDFRFKKRVWFLKSKETICDGCSKGCSVFADEEHDTIYRYRARHHKQVNDHWICDEGRVSFHAYQTEDRIVQPLLAPASKQAPLATNWQTLIPWMQSQLKTAKKALVVFGTDVSSEEAAFIQKELPLLMVHAHQLDMVFYNSAAVSNSAQDAPEDQLLRQKDHTPNTRGLEALGLKSLEIDAAQATSYDLLIHIKSQRASTLPRKFAEVQIAWGVWTAKEITTASYDAVLPGLSYLEKKGSFINSLGIKQSFAPVVHSKGSCASIEQVFQALKTAVRHPVDHKKREVSVESI